MKKILIAIGAAILGFLAFLFGNKQSPNYKQNKQEILKKLEEKKNETKTMSDDDLLNDVNNKLNKRRNNK